MFGPGAPAIPRLLAAMGFEGPGAVVTFAAVPLGRLVATTAIEHDTSTTEEDP